MPKRPLPSPKQRVWNLQRLLSLKLVKPRKPRKKKDEESEKEPVTVGAPKSEDDAGGSDDDSGETESGADES